MRMKELAARTGFPASTIHFYLGEGLVPPPVRRARNSAEYGDVHVERLRLIRELRGEGAELPLRSVRRVVELVERGVEPRVALALHRAVVGSLPGAGEHRRYDLAALARASGLTSERARTLVDLGILVPTPDEEPPFDATDVHIARMLADALDAFDLDPREIARIATLLREASALEMDLRNRVVHGLAAPAAAEVSGRLQEWVNVWHTYVLTRARQHEISRHGLGPAEAVRDEENDA